MSAGQNKPSKCPCFPSIGAKADLCLPSCVLFYLCPLHYTLGGNKCSVRTTQRQRCRSTGMHVTPCPCGTLLSSIHHACAHIGNAYPSRTPKLWEWPHFLATPPEFEPSFVSLGCPRDVPGVYDIVPFHSGLLLLFPGLKTAQAFLHQTSLTFDCKGSIYATLPMKAPGLPPFSGNNAI